MTVANGSVKINADGTKVTVLRSVGNGDWLVQDAAGRRSVVQETHLHDDPIDEASVRGSTYVYSATSLYYAEDVALSAPETPTKVQGDAAVLWEDLDDTLPAGLTLDADTGAIDGTPTTEDLTGATVRIRFTTDAGYKDVITLLIRIGDAPTLSYPDATIELAEDVAMSPISPTFGGDGTPAYTVQTGSLPTGMAISATTGIISGTPATEDLTGAAVTIRVTTAYGHADFAFTAIKVGDAPTLSYADSPLSLTQDSAMANADPTFSGDGTPVYTIFGSPALPAGLSINSGSGRISGTPTNATEDRTCVVRVTTEYGTADANVVIDIATP